MCRWILVGTRNVPHRICSGNENTRFVFNDFIPENRSDCGITWKYRRGRKSLPDFRPLRYSRVGMVMPKGFMSTEGETLQVSVLPYRCSKYPPLVKRQMLNFGKFQDTDRFLIPCPRHVSSRLPPSGETCKYATAPSTQKNLERFSTY
jgi:hypothetical protein